MELTETYIQRVNWSKLVWHLLAILKHSLCVWLFLLNRNPTCNKLANWRITNDKTCLLCQSFTEPETISLFDCSYTSSIWFEDMTRIGHTFFLLLFFDYELVHLSS